MDAIYEPNNFYAKQTKKNDKNNHLTTSWTSWNNQKIETKKQKNDKLMTW